ncbi:MAG: MATE family efflux transporter [Lentisphaerae bacterium]|nr:MATE family efflux transporter [Lentisphaerota bacterium]
MLRQGPQAGALIWIVSMLRLSQRLRAHLDGDGGVRQILSIAVPMFISQAADTLMMFASRFFLARVGQEHMAAALSGGITAFMCFTFFIGVIGYGNALVAQYLGSGQRQTCGLAAAQGVFLAVLSYPVILLVSPAGLWLMRSSGHEPVQRALEAEYYRILILFAVFPLLRAAFGSFFSGIGRTRVVMLANGIGMAVNILLNYVLVLGSWGFPALGLRGAAIGSIAASMISVGILAAAYLSQAFRHDYGTLAGLRWNRDVFLQLLRFGLPSGLELFLNVTAFTLFVQFMHSYGRDVAAAVTITFNWDLVAFSPLLGMSVATMSLVGRYMGARRPDLAERSAYSGMKASLWYTTIIFVLFLAVPEALAGLFTPGGAGAHVDAIMSQAVFMIRLASIYLLSDAVLLVFGGALRGAGDTRWAMVTSVTCNWVLTIACWVLIRVVKASPEVAWIVFVGMITVTGGIFLARFRGGRWKALRVLDAPAVAPTH